MKRPSRGGERGWHRAIGHHGRAAPGRRGRRQRGVAVLEAAFITPVFFIMVFGIIEIGLAMNDYLAVANSVRSGARLASAYGNDPYSDWAVLQAVARESTALDRKNLKSIVIFEPSGFGDKPSATCQAGTSVTGQCNVYTTAAFAADKNLYFGCTPAAALDKAWCPSTRKVSQGGTGPEYVGVWLKYDHAWVTKMFGSTKTLTDSSVIRLEPRTS